MLYKLIIKLLETKIISMYAKSVLKVNHFDAQHSARGVIVFDHRINKDFHIEGTEFEKISHVCVVYLDIDDEIYGGNLRLGGYYEELIFRTNKGDIILFPNMEHKIDNIGIRYPRRQNVKNKKTTNDEYKRRILTFWFCDTDKGCPQFKDTPAFAEMQRGDSVTNHDIDESCSEKENVLDLLSKRPELTYLVDNTPVLTAKDMLPLDVRHHDDLLIKMVHFIQSTIDEGFRLSSNIPKEIGQIIVDYAIETHRQFLRDENGMQSNANQLRAFRRNWTLFYDDSKWRKRCPQAS